MTISQQTTSLLDTMREAGPDKHVQSVGTVQDTPGYGSNGHSLEMILQPGPAHHPCAYPVWPTSQPGPQATLPPVGQYPHPRRTDQVVYTYYDQERGMPDVVPPGSTEQKQRGRTYIPDDTH